MKTEDNHIRNHAVLIWTLVAITTMLSLGSARLASARPLDANWTYTGNLNSAREYHTATLLPNGIVLVAGGFNYLNALNSAELYNPATGTWSSTSNLNNGRSLHTATLLPNGKVLVAGGFDNDYTLNSAELYDPVTGTWSSTGNLNTARGDHTATLLPNGKVLVAGGWNHYDVASAELYDPDTGTWSSAGNLNTARESPTATLLPKGKVLVAGGWNNDYALTSAEVYNPVTGTWSSTGNLNTARGNPKATLLPGGKVLIVDEYSNTAELYDPGMGTWSSTGNLNNTVRGATTVTLLPGGNVLAVGGYGNLTPGLYDAASETWSFAATLNRIRGYHTATLLPSGKVLVAGGTDNFSRYSTNSAELYDPGITPNQIDDAQFFVRQHYRDFLNREPDPDGLAFWTNEINLCGGEAQCVEVKSINDSASFFLSIEFQQTGYLVYRIYKASYGDLPNAPVPIKLDEFLPDTQEIGKNVIVKQTGWEETLENNKQAFTAEFVQRQRFVSAYPTSLAPDAFVDALFTNAGVTPSDSDRALAIAEFGAATNTTEVGARVRALRRIAENATLAQQEFNRAFVLMQYFGYLRRNPNDAPEATLDFQGYKFWLNKLDSFNGNFIGAEMVKAFLSSSEYRRRFGL
jgi:hypothetical protein